MRIGIVEHNLVQVLYLLSAPGAMLIVLGVAATQRESKKWLLKILCVCAIAVLLLLPIGHYYSHYEAVYFAPRWLGIGLALPLFAGLVLHTRNALREGPMAMASGQVLLVVTALSLAGVVAPNAREDMSSRVFVTLSPALFALSLESAHRFQKHFLGASTAFRHATKTLVVALVFYPVAHSFNYTMDWRARHTVDLAGKQNVAKINDGDLFLFNHYVEWWIPRLGAAGALEDVDDWTFMHVPAWLPVDLYETARWIHPTVLHARSHRDTHGPCLLDDPSHQRKEGQNPTDRATCLDTQEHGALLSDFRRAAQPTRRSSNDPVCNPREPAGGTDERRKHPMGTNSRLQPDFHQPVRLAEAPNPRKSPH